MKRSGMLNEDLNIRMDIMFQRMLKGIRGLEEREILRI
jgi:hypothetical protein